MPLHMNANTLTSPTNAGRLPCLALVLMLLPALASAQTTPKTYSTEFTTVENPISEGGAWGEGGLKTGLDWTNVRTNGSIAHGTQTGSDGYDDSIALLTGFGPDYRIDAVVHFVGSRSSSTDSHEVELILRGSYGPRVQRIYECNLGYSGSSGWYAQIILLNGSIGTFESIGDTVAAVPNVRDGDVFSAEIRGNVINTYLNGVKLKTATNSVLTTGQPGIGFFWRGTEQITDFGFKSLTVTELGAAGPRRPNPPTNVQAR